CSAHRSWSGPRFAKSSGRHQRVRSVQRFNGVSERRRGNVMINRRTGIRAMKRGLLAVFLVFALSSVSQAGPLNVNIDPFPNILASFITTTYIATTGAFTANGWAMTLDTGTTQTSITQPFVLTANITNAGV